MKMKEQNAYLSLVGFFQVIFLALTGEFVNELLKPEKDLRLLLGSLLSGLLAAGFVIGIYIRVFNKRRKHK